jgi:tetratricopeptide (TPR) repeat protein
MAFDNSTTQIIGRRYVLNDHLGMGGMGTVYRAIDRLTGQTVALKRVTASPGDLTFTSKGESGSTLLALATEFRTLASLRHPNIISVLDYGFDEAQRPYFTMEYLPDAKTIIQAGRGKTQEEQLGLILNMLQALVYLHRRGILHRDLKPGNVLVAQGQLKVVDFGLSMEIRTRSALDAPQATAGTLAYMAPELFHGLPVSRASDLYAVGIIAYELFTGHHPFNTNNIALLINEILNKAVNVSDIGLGENLALVLKHLLAKDPQERSSDVSQVIRDLCQATNLPLPPETEAIREGFLQAAKFVGRGADLSQLTEALNATLAGHGSSQLVSGESGVGKSRLLEELRTLALVKGAVVLRGQAVSEGGRVYQVWRDMLPFLCIITELEDVEASILKPLVPDISNLLRRNIPDPPLADPQTTQNRLFALIIKLFQRQTQPVVLILEDLHWAGSGSMGLIKHISREAPNMPLFLIGSFRDDEIPNLPEHIPGAHVLKLSRLDDPSIKELSASILGETGRQPAIVDLLRRETEGIPFFLVEVVRALAEHAGELSQIGQRLLPEKILAGGIEQIIERRLNRVPEDARPLLQMAAVIGRELDLSVLQRLRSITDMNLWLTLCADRAVLEVQENRWRFTHDKLREHILEELSVDELPILHRRAAEAIESAYSDSTKHAAILAHLWQAAGNEEKELHYSEVAGQQELSNSVYVEGIRFLQRALELLLKQDDTPERAQRELRLQLLLGPALMNLYGQSHPIVAETYSRASRLGQETQQIDNVFKVLWGLCANAFVGGNLSTAEMIVRQLFEVADQTGNSLHRLEAYHAAWTTALWQGATRSAEDYFQQGMPIYNKEDFHQACVSLQGHDTATCGKALGAMNLWLYGYPDRAWQRSRAAYELAVDVHHPFSLAFGLLAQSMIGLLTRDVNQLEQWTEEFFNYSFQNKYNFFMTLAGMTHGWYVARIGRFPEGVQQMIKSIEAMHQGKTYGPRPLLISAFMDVYRMAGQIDEGLQVFHKELEDHPITGERIMEPEIRRLYGELLLMQDNSQQAEQEFQLALNIARKQEAKSLELRAGMSLARLWQSQNKPQEAHQLLFGIYTWFTEGFDTADLQEAKALLEKFS